MPPTTIIRTFMVARRVLSRLRFRQSPLIENLHIDAVGILDVQTGIRIVFRSRAALPQVPRSRFLAEAGHPDRKVVHHSGRTLSIEGNQRAVGPEPNNSERLVLTDH